MSKVKLVFVADSTVSDELLHCLYTTVRFKEEKIANINEDFKIFREGRMINIIMNEDKIENDDEMFSFYDVQTNRHVRVKLIKKSKYIGKEFQKDRFVEVSCVLSYATKQRVNDKAVFVCPVNFDGTLNKESKNIFVDYLERETGLDFKNAIGDKELIRFERLFTDEQHIINDSIRKKVLFRNVIMIRATLKVVDAEKVSALGSKMLGRRRSYGFGNFSVDAVVA
jgi:hypothetical protein